MKDMIVTPTAGEVIPTRKRRNAVAFYQNTQFFGTVPSGLTPNPTCLDLSPKVSNEKLLMLW